jgi:Recombinase zinc beta ribbon domain
MRSGVRSAARTYVLSGRLTCGICGRRMQSHWKREVRYRCVYPKEYALTGRLGHPKTVYVREAPIEEALDAWLATVFDPTNIDETIALLSSAAAADLDGASAVREKARRRVVDCSAASTNVRQHCMLELLSTSSRNGATASNGNASPPSALLPESTLSISHSPKKTSNEASLYGALGIKLTYQPANHLVVVEASPTSWCGNERVGGPITPVPTPVLRGIVAPAALA